MARRSAPSTLLLAVLIVFCQALTAHSQVLVKEIISREYAIHVGGIQTPGIKEIVSREASLFIENGPANPYPQVVSRETSVLVATPEAPPPVTDIVVTPSATGDSVALSWSSYNPWQVADVDHYEIYVSGQPFTDVSGKTPILIVGAETLEATVTGLPTFRDHYIAVVAVDILGNRDTTVVTSTAYVISPEVISREVSLFVGGDRTSPYREVISREASLLVSNSEVPAPVTGLESGFTVGTAAAPTGLWMSTGPVTMKNRNRMSCDIAFTWAPPTSMT